MCHRRGRPQTDRLQTLLQRRYYPIPLSNDFQAKECLGSPFFASSSNFSGTMNITVSVCPVLHSCSYYLIMNVWAGYFIFIVLALVVRVMVAPGLGVVFLALLYASIWAPQIMRAARRGRPCALGRKYVIGTTVGRMLLAMCMHSQASNIRTELNLSCRSPWMSQERDGRGTTSYVTCQLLSRFYSFVVDAINSLGIPALVIRLRTSGDTRTADLIRACVLPPTARMLFEPIPLFINSDLMAVRTQLADSQGYDYHPPLPDTEGGPLGDCAICMDAIDRPPEDVSGKSIRRGIRARASYSLAPCAHLFVGIFLFSPRHVTGALIVFCGNLTAYSVSRAGELSPFFFARGG
jgi:hypothetical protein